VVTRAVVLLAAFAACGAPARPVPSHEVRDGGGDEITLYRDRALVKQRVEVVVPVAAKATITVRLPIGIDVDDIAVLDRGELIVSELRAADAQAGGAPPPPKPPELDEILEDIEAPEDTADEEEVAPTQPTQPTVVTFVASGPRAGNYALYLGYVTDRIKWDAAYTMTTTPARSHVQVRGAIAIKNSTGIAYAKARTYVLDTELGAWRGRVAEQLGMQLTGGGPPGAAPAEPRPLGTIALGTGETRIELMPGDPPRRMSSVLVYDPIGTKLDHGGSAPTRDPSLGVVPAAGTRVTESFEVKRPDTSTGGLPGGPVRLLERRPDGSLAVLGETRLFDAATRVAGEDTVAIGTADGVTGKRERRDFTIDDDNKRLVEEFVLTLTNTRAVPVEVVLREHLYRGQNWTLAYRSVLEAQKEGAQQISMRTTVPAHGATKVLYVVVYTWEPATK
jgi:hypothetical protein